MRHAFFLLLGLLGALALVHAQKGHDFFARPAMPGQPPYPIWPKQFSADYDVLVPAYVSSTYLRLPNLLEALEKPKLAKRPLILVSRPLHAPNLTLIHAL